MIKEIITSKTRRKLLTLFLSNPNSKFYTRELARKTGDYINSIRVELNKLESTGLIKSEKIANLKYYSVNKECVIYNELKSIISKTDPVTVMVNQTLKDLKQKFKKNLSSVVIFGSLAKNNLNFNDIDILVIVKELPKDWRERDNMIIEIEKIGLRFGITLHIELLTNKEFEFSINEGAPLLFELSLANKIVYDNGFFKRQMKIFKKNIIKWKAKKINNVWEVPELAVKV